MVKKNVLILSILIIFSIVSAIAVLNIKPHNSTNNQVNDIKVTPTAEVLPIDTGKTAIQNNTGSINEVIKSEDVQVLNNSPVIDLKIRLYENSSNDTFLEFGFNNSQSVKKELDSNKIPELKNMFEKRDAESGNVKGNIVRKAYLNQKYEKAYIMIEGSPDIEGVDTAIYAYNLKDYSLIKLTAEVGTFTDMYFSGDSNYLAFSYFTGTDKDNPFLQVVNCETDKFKVNRNKYQNSASMGNLTNSKCYYSFVKWFSNEILELKENSYAVGANGLAPSSKKQRSVLYNINKNAFVNPDGGVLQQVGGTNKAGAQTNANNGPVVTIKNFYTYLSKDEYKKAYDLLDDTFSFNAFKGLGIPGFKKSSISEKKFPDYGNILKMTRFDSIVTENITGNTAKIYFYIMLSTGKGLDIKSPLIADLKKTGKTWKIVSVNDGNALEPPFKEK